MRAFFTALGIVMGTLIIILVTVLLMYVSYILAIGVSVILAVWLVYNFVIVVDKVKKSK